MVKSREQIKDELIEITMSCTPEEAVSCLRSIANKMGCGDAQEELEAEVAQDLIKSILRK